MQAANKHRDCYYGVCVYTLIWYVNSLQVYIIPTKGHPPKTSFGTIKIISTKDV